MFIHLHLYSAYSLSEGAIKIKEIPKIARKHKMPAVAITDRGNLFGALEFSIACTDVGIQPIIGCQIPIKIKDQITYLGLLAQNEIGYKNLMYLSSQLYLNEKWHFAKSLPMEAIDNHNDGLLALSGGHAGPLGYFLNQNKLDYSKDLLKKLTDLFPQRFYMEIQRHFMPIETHLEPQFLDLAYEYEIPLIATNAVYFDVPSMFHAHDALLCIAEGRYVEEENRRKVTPEHYFKSQEEMEQLFKDLPEAIQNTAIVAQRCSYMPTTRNPILPPYTQKGESEKDVLNEKAKQGLVLRLKKEVFPIHLPEEQDNIRQIYFDRINYELEIIDKMGFSGYFLIVSDFIQWAKAHSIPVGPGRGSGAGSLVAWSLTITDIDPIRFNLIFERFLNPERVSMPDFDIDFCQDRRDEVIEYVQSKYGEDKVAHIITFGKLQARAVLRDVGRVLQMPYNQVDRICKLIPHQPTNPVNLEQALEMEPLLRDMVEQDENVAKLMNIGKQLEGLYRHASTHAAGVVIGDRPLLDLIPLYKDEGSKLSATQFNMKYTELAGLVKFDFLGLKTLTIIEKASQLIRSHYGIEFDIRYIPLDDYNTFKLLCNVETVGIFQVEGSGMREVLRKLQPDRFEDLIALVALYRPGPMDDIPRYLACKHGHEPVTYLHPELKSILEPTYGVMVYQEQVMQIAQMLGGYTLGAADLLRRAMGKKIKSEMDAQRELFVKGAITHGVAKDTAEQIFEQMAKFAGYGFNKSHSAPYALLTYQTAYLKANYPLEFFSSTMTYDMHNTDKLNIYRQDLQRANIKLLPPDVNYSAVEFTVEGDAVRYGLAAIKNLGANSMDELIKNRQKYGKFKDIQNFAERIQGLNKKMIENLASAGALDSIHPNRRQLFDNTELLARHMQEFEKNSQSKQKTLFKSEEYIKNIALPPVNDWDYLSKLSKEFSALGFYLNNHPLSLYDTYLKQISVISSNQLEEIRDARKLRLAGIIMQKQERTSKAGQKFAFVQFSDKNGLFEVAFFSEIYQKYRDLLVEGKPLLLDVNVRFDKEQLRVTAQSLAEIALQNKKIIFQITPDIKVENILNFIKQLNLGNDKITLKVEIGQDLPAVYLKLSQKCSWDPLLEEKANQWCKVIVN